MNSYPQPTLPPLSLSARAHDDAEVVLWCRAGRAEVHVDGHPVALGPGDAVRIGRGVEHRATTQPGTVLVPVILDAPRERGPRSSVLRGAGGAVAALLGVAHVDGFSRIEVDERMRACSADRIRSLFERGGFERAGAGLGAAESAAAAPAAASRWIDDEHERMLLWCARGRAAVTIDAGDGGPVRELRIGTDQALLLPSGLSHRSRTQPGGVLIPVTLGPGDGASERRPTLLHLPTRLRAAAAFHGAVALSDLLPDRPEGLELHPAVDDLPLEALPPGTPRWRAQRIRLALHDAPGDPSTLDDWAARFGVSRRSVERSFTGSDGRSFAEWRHALRMRRAVDWLDEGRQAKWISLRLGFAHLSAFSRAFSRHHGVTVREHQTAAREQAPALR